MRAFFPQATIHRIDLVVPEQFSNELKKKNPMCTGSSAMNLLACTWMFSDEPLATRVHGNVYTWVLDVQR